jgi:hypothetical protein
MAHDERPLLHACIDQLVALLQRGRSSPRQQTAATILLTEARRRLVEIEVKAMRQDERSTPNPAPSPAFRSPSTMYRVGR